MPTKIIGRKKEIAILDSFYNLNKTEFLAIYGRKSRIINLCEIKYSDTAYVIDKDYYAKLPKKIAVYKHETDTNK